LKHEGRERTRNARRAFAPFVVLREFRGSQFAGLRPRAQPADVQPGSRQAVNERFVGGHQRQGQPPGQRDVRGIVGGDVVGHAHQFGQAGLGQAKRAQRCLMRSG
jgi:hypothetical protein